MCILGSASFAGNIYFKKYVEQKGYNCDIERGHYHIIKSTNNDIYYVDDENMYTYIDILGIDCNSVTTTNEIMYIDEKKAKIK